MQPSRGTQWKEMAAKNAKFAALLKQIRTEAGLSQTEMSKKLDRPQPYISKLENSRAFITLVEFEEYTLAVGLNPAKVLSRVYK
jgi:transcriptional regulator with XRE-family HTH domain